MQASRLLLRAWVHTYRHTLLLQSVSFELKGEKRVTVEPHKGEISRRGRGSTCMSLNAFQSSDGAFVELAPNRLVYCLSIKHATGWQSIPDALFEVWSDELLRRIFCSSCVQGIRTYAGTNGSYTSGSSLKMLVSKGDLHRRYYRKIVRTKWPMSTSGGGSLLRRRTTSPLSELCRPPSRTALTQLRKGSRTSFA